MNIHAQGHSSNSSGRSMVEMLGVLAIIAVLSAGSLAGYSKAMEKHKTNKLKEEIQMITSNMMTAFQNQYDYSALGTDQTSGTTVATQLNIIPREMIQSDGTVLHPFKGNVYIYAVDYAGVTNGAFKIDMEGLPQKVAMDLAMSSENEENPLLMNLQLTTHND